MTVDRDALAADRSVRGRALAERYCAAADEWLIDLFESATEGRSGLSLVALGGYGRRELSLQSDLDVALLHDGHPDIAAIADRIWYPVWDAGVKLGHAVRTLKEALALAGDDLDSATALLPARHLAGDASLSADLIERHAANWQKKARRWLPELAARVEERHLRAGEVAFLLEPDVKEGRGGLRDVHSLGWAEQARPSLWETDHAALAEAHGVLLDARVELHRRTGRPGDRLLLQEQDAVAEALGDDDADELMRRVAAAARTIAWTSDEAWQRIRASLARTKNLLGRRRSLSAELVLRDGEVHLEDGVDLNDPVLPLRAATAAAEHTTSIARSSLDAMTRHTPHMPEPWPEGARDALVDLLRGGPGTIYALESLDQADLLVRILPEWDTVRSRPQRNAYHTFTVDRHLCEAAVNAAQLADRVDRPDLLLVGTWLHDLGKGVPGDHTEVGMELVAAIGARMGFDDHEVAVLVSLVEHHLLLPDVATRRDLDDPLTIESVADAVGSLQTLRLLHALTEADSKATGPSAWGSWKAELVATLVERVSHVLGGGDVVDVTDDFPGPEHAELLATDEPIIRGEGEVLTVAVDDRPGLFGRVAGVLALNGIDVLDAHVGTVGHRAIEVLRVQSSTGPTIRWDKVIDDLEAALEGRLALSARLAERARAYARDVPLASPIVPSVVFHHDESDESTVVEVRARDAVGVLSKITGSFTEFDLDIVKAKVQTLGHEVVDTFYLQDDTGKLDDPMFCRELERAVLHALST